MYCVLPDAAACVDDKDTDILVPYEIKKVGFSKVFPDMYVLVDTDTHRLTHNLGPVTVLENYYTYRMHCKNLVLPPMRVSESTLRVLPMFGEDRSTWQVFSIDGPATRDFDDAFSVRVIDAESVLVSVYIANVTRVIDHMGLWETLSERVSSIYLPHTRQTLLPDTLVKRCSLTSGQTVNAFVMDRVITRNSTTTTFSECFIRPQRNYTYLETGELDDLEAYKTLRDHAGTSDPSAVVEYWMRAMNFAVGKELTQRKKGIFRTLNVPLEDVYPSNSFIAWSSVDGSADPYAYATSPLRRLVDLLNIADLIDGCSSTAQKVCAQWLSQLDKLNAQSKNIRRVQNESILLDRFPDIAGRALPGRVLETETMEAGIVKYSVYFPDLRLTHRVVVPSGIPDEDTSPMFEAFHFENASRFRQKIRFQYINKNIV